MRRKYIISRDTTEKNLKIREYAIIDKNLNKVESSMLRKEHYSFLCEEIYKSDTITQSISKGINTLVTVLRTEKMFPIKQYATKIAESVIILYGKPDSGKLELFFDDVDFYVANI